MTTTASRGLQEQQQPASHWPPWWLRAPPRPGRCALVHQPEFAGHVWPARLCGAGPVYVAPPQPIYYAPRLRSTTRRAPSTVLRPSWSFPATDTAMAAATGVDTVASTAMAMATGMATGAVDLS